jgi:hypothetical protein
MKKIQNRPIAVHKLPTPVPELIKVAQATVTALTGNAFFPNPVPPLSTVTAAIAGLDTTETATKTRAPGTVAARDAAKVTLLTALRQLKGYVQGVADASPEQAEAIITSAGMTVRKTPTRNKAALAVKFGDVTGSVKLAAKAAAQRASYDWEWSGDGGKTWTQVASTMQAHTTIGGLPVGTSVMFRVRSLTKVGEGDWGQPVSLLVK